MRSSGVTRIEAGGEESDECLRYVQDSIGVLDGWAIHFVSHNGSLESERFCYDFTLLNSSEL